MQTLPFLTPLPVQLECVWSVNTTTAMRLYAQRLAGMPTSYSSLTVPYEFVYVESSITGAIGSGLLTVSANTSYFGVFLSNMFK